MESLIASCERSGHFVDNTKFVAEVLKILKDRMDDAQANNKPIAANAIAHLIASLETEPAAKLTKMHVASALIGGLGDIKKGMRDAVVSALDILVTQSKGGKNADPLLMTPFIGPIAEVLKNPVGRLELLTWITNHSYAIKSDLVAEWVVPLVAGMQDKVAVVRTLSENLLVEISGRSLCAKSKIERGFQDLSPSVMRNLQASYTKIIQSYGTTNGSAPVAVVTKAAAAVAVEVDEHSQGPADEDIQEKVAERPPMRKTSSSIGSGKAAAKAAPEEEDVIPSAEKFFLKRILKSAKLKRLEEFANLNWPGRVMQMRYIILFLSNTGVQNILARQSSMHCARPGIRSFRTSCPRRCSRCSTRKWCCRRRKSWCAASWRCCCRSTRRCSCSTPT
jgi:hypothetical protein